MAFLGRKNIWFLILIWTCITSFDHVLSQSIDSAEPSEQQVKAAYLYNFAKFVEWPDSTFKNETDPIRIAIIGHDPFGTILDQTVQNKSINARPFQVERFQTLPIGQQFHIIYIGSQDIKLVKTVLKQLNNLPVLTVGDMETFAASGGCINFILKQNRILFEINIDASQRAGLTISSRLLRLAVLVEEET